ncbi:MAG: glutamate synthase subunit beta [Candidatus Omnitrophota bacterium]|jgi:glutamate synthase (NADPH/NADH) small chain
MGDAKGFLKFKRRKIAYRPVGQRVRDFAEVAVLPKKEDSEEQASRCMDCGTPFCHGSCPAGNYIPEWNDLVFHKQWDKAFILLAATNNLPEITGRICPALCEYACVLGINDESVAIRDNELAVIEYAFKHGIIKPKVPKKRTGKSVAVIGSGPAGLACADQLNKAGHLVTVFEKADKVGGILRYGIPDFKLAKWVLERRISLFKKEGIIFSPGIDVGAALKASYLTREFDAICLAGGSGVPRDLNIEGRDLSGIYFAMDYLTQANKRVSHEKIPLAKLIDAKGKTVVVLGGGDTGADCLGVAHRQGAKSVVQVELLAKPPECRTPDYPWPKYPLLCKTTTSHEEGGIRKWSVATEKFIGRSGRVEKLLCQKLTGGTPEGKFEIEADLVILALGFLHPEPNGIIKDLGLELTARGNVKTDAHYMTNLSGVFSAGDMHRGQSLVIWAISEGRQAAYCIDKYLMGESCLPKI